MQKIEKLTARQEKQLVEHRDEWLKIGLQTGASDKETSKRIISNFYERIGKKAPQFIFVQSPLGAQVLLNLISRKSINLPSAESQLGASLWDSLRASLWASLRDSLGDSLRASLRDSLGDSLWASLGDSLRDSLWDSKLNFYSTWFWGSVDSYWIAYYLFAQQYLKQGIYETKKLELLQQWGELAKSCFWWYAYEDVCIVCDRPTSIKMDERYRLHSVDSPAVSFGDGWNIYAIHGVRVAENIVMHPELITSDMVMQERNAELQRIMVEQMGEDTFISQGGFKPIHEDYYGKLYRVEFPNDEPLLKVRVVCPSTQRIYYLGVPARDWDNIPIIHAKQAVAWTWGMKEDEYMLEMES